MNESDEYLSIENANFIILSLIRELYNLAQQANTFQKAVYQKQINQLQSELKYLNKDELCNKAKNLYAPYLKELMEK